MANPTPKSVIHHNPEELDNMRFLKKKRFLIPVAVAVAMIAGGSAFAYFDTAGAGTGSASVGTASNLQITQTGTVGYNSRIAPSLYVWSQCWECVQATEIGEEINLANGGGQLNNVVVDMQNWDTPAGTEPFTLNIYDAASGDLPGALLATSTVTADVPATLTGENGVPPTYGIALFSVTFDNFTYTADDYSNYGGALPATVVYGVEGFTTSEPGEGVNLSLSSESYITAGSDAASGTVFVSTTGGNGDAGGSTGELTCSDVSSTFAQYKTTAGPGGSCGWASVPAPWGPNVIPAVQFNMDSTLSGLYPGGPVQDINLSVYNPGSTPVQLNTLTVSVPYNTGTSDVETTAGDPATDVTGCNANWFSINGGGISATGTFDETVPAGNAITLTGDFNISMLNPDTSQDACEGANFGLTFSSN
jgi:hypothetical protein